MKKIAKLALIVLVVAIAATAALAACQDYTWDPSVLPIPKLRYRATAA